MALRRLRIEQKKLTKAISKGEIVGINVTPKEGALAWDVDIFGPEDSPYENGIFKVLIEFPPDYPFKAPTVKFLTRTWNPSISDKGEICLEMLTKWKPVVQVQDILLTLRSLLQDPSPDGAQNSEAAEQFKDDKAKFLEKAKEWTQSYAAP